MTLKITLHWMDDKIHNESRYLEISSNLENVLYFHLTYNISTHNFKLIYTALFIVVDTFYNVNDIRNNQSPRAP